MADTNGSPSTSIKFRFKNIGPVNEAELELGDLTIIAGRNNTGKTYLVYTLYGFLQNWTGWPNAQRLLMGELDVSQSESKEQPLVIEGLAREILEEEQATRFADGKKLNRERRALIRALARDFTKTALSDVFSSPGGEFERASIDVQLDGDFHRRKGEIKATTSAGDMFSLQYDGQEIVIDRVLVDRRRHDSSETLWCLAQLYLRFLFPDFNLETFVLSAERFGISLFYKELDFAKNRLVDVLQQMGNEKESERFFLDSLVEQNTSRYALPIKDNIAFTRSIADLQKEKSEFHEHRLFDDIKDIMDGYFRSESDEIRFKSKARKEHSFTIPLYLASSSVRGLSDLYFFLRHVAQENHLLIVDEPESHLDTANQILLARLLARCVRAGMKVLITTHSDYLIKEINNLIMLARPFADKKDVIKKLRYREDDFLAPESVRAYIAEKHTLSQCEVDEFGIDMPVFDETIDKINTVANELASRVAESVEA